MNKDRKEHKDSSQEKSNGDIGLSFSQETFSEISGILQRRKVFITINITLLLVAFILGRIIYFQVPGPERREPNALVKQEFQILKDQYNPYQWSTLNRGVFFFRDTFKNTSTGQISARSSIYFGSIIEKSELAKIMQYTIETPKGKFRFNKGTTATGNGIKIQDKSGCYQEDCYVKIIVDFSDPNLELGSYKIFSDAKSANGRRILSTQDYFTHRYQSVIESNPIDYTVSTEPQGMLNFNLKTDVRSKYLRAEIEGKTADGKSFHGHKIFSVKLDKKYQMSYPLNATGMKIYLTTMSSIRNDDASRLHYIMGNYSE